MTLDPEKWEEVEPCFYQRKAYTPEQIALLNRRPTELINEALANARRALPQTERAIKAGTVKASASEVSDDR